MQPKLFRQIDISALVFFRIAFGILAMAEAMALFFFYHLHEKTFEPDSFHFKYYGFEWVQPFPEPWMSIFFSILVLSAIFITLGKWYRLATIIYATFFIYTFLIEKTMYLNHGYLLCWLAATMIFLPANRAFSLDVLKDPAIRRTTVPAWCIWILCFYMGVVYFFGGIAKINPDWLEAIPLKLWLQAKGRMPVIGPILKQEWVAWVMSYTGLLLDLFVVFFLLLRKTRIYAFLFAVAFHLVNFLIFNIGIFPWLSICLTLLFFPSDSPRKWVKYLGDKIKFIRRWENAWQNRVADFLPNQSGLWQENPNNHKPILMVFVFLAGFHCIYPLRHHFIKDNVAWTEEGHRYAWRMMLRTKYGRAEFTVKTLDTGETFVINPKDSLSPDQGNDLVSHPDMILQYAHHLRDQYQEKLGKPVAVYAEARVRLNGKDYQDYINPEVDLAAEEWSFFKHAEWILPYK
ncbi:MAG: HTTM domain-containing protein, partial [Saprospiraceae bacterium]|nr:HTTM domain-containing protein [Saprospiraceae bacterium]